LLNYMLKYKIPQIVTLTRIKEWGKENKIKKSLNARNSRICIINFDNLWSV